jgi:hypothetical protein
MFRHLLETQAESGDISIVPPTQVRSHCATAFFPYRAKFERPCDVFQMDVHLSVVDSASEQQVNINMDDFNRTNLIRSQSSPELTQLELCLRLKSAQFEVSDFKQGCFSISVMRSAGYTLDSLKVAGFNLGSLKSSGYDAAALKSAGYDFVALKGAGFSDVEITEAGFNIKELKVCSAKHDRVFSSARAFAHVEH